MSETLLQVLLIICSISCLFANTCVENKSSTSIVPNREGGKLKWAIVALTRPGRSDVRTRNAALVEIMKPYADKHDFSALFFSEKKFPVGEVEALTRVFKDVATVKVIDTANRGFNMPEKYGYKYMCKFFALDIYDYLQDYDYYMRCDTDCYIKNVKYDIFKWAEDAHLGYGFALRKLEAHGPTKQLMPVWVNKYISTCSILPSAVMDEPLSVCFNFYNNWHMGRVDFFLQPNVQHFLKAVNASGEILANRWGDSTIQAYAVRLFMEPQQILQIPEFTYVHGSHDKMVSTHGDGSTSQVPQRLPNWKYTAK